MSDLRSAADKIARAAKADGARIDQIDTVLCESGDVIMFYSYAGDRAFMASMNLPFVVKSEDEFLSREWGEALVRLLPAAILADSVNV